MKTIKDVVSLIRLIGISGFLNLIRSLRQNTIYFRGFFVSSCIGTLLKTPFFEELTTKDGVDLSEFCKKNDYDIYFMRAICDYLVSLSLLDLAGNMYRIRKSFRIGPSIGGYQFINAYYSVFENLSNLLSRRKKYGTDVNRDIKYVTAGSAETERIIPYPYAKRLLEKYKCKSILDLGCGNGQFLIYLSDILSEKSYGIDISDVAVQEGITNISKHHLTERIHLLQSDIRQLGNIKSINPDALTLVYILHELVGQENNSNEIIKILERLRTSFPDSKLIVLEACRYDVRFLRKRKSFLVEHHLFHRVSKQSLLTFENWKDIFLESGYKILEATELRIVGQAFFVLE